MTLSDLDAGSFVAGFLTCVGVACFVYVGLLLVTDNDAPRATPDDRLYEPYD